jgi:DNA-binding response OmpR family regulator
MSDAANTKILIVDDDVTSLDIVDFLLVKSGFEVTRSTDGTGALRELEAEIPDIILIDLMMPEMNGQECVRRIRERKIEVPIVAFTAVDDPEVHQEALDMGCDLVLTKPCRPALLVEHINTLLAEK